MTFHVSVADVAQIAILYLVFYAVLKAARGSRFGQALMGGALLFGVLIAFTYLFQFDVLARMLYWMLSYLAISSVVIFQPEIRRALVALGALLFSDKAHAFDANRVTPERMTDVLFELSKRKTGALVAFERGISLRGYETSGVELDALVSTALVVSVFTEPLPLHDGGMVIRRGRIASAHCVFPVSHKVELSVSGMRHRAAVGLSEETDAVVAVVSEETGRISIAHNGRLVRFPDLGPATQSAVLRWVRKAMPVKRTASEEIAEWFQARLRKLRAKKELPA